MMEDGVKIATFPVTPTMNGMELYNMQHRIFQQAVAPDRVDILCS